MAKSTVASSGLFPGNYIGGDWTETDDARDLAYGLKVNSDLALLVYMGLGAFERETGTPPDGVYAMLEAVIHDVSIGAERLAKKLEAMPDGVA